MGRGSNLSKVLQSLLLVLLFSVLLIPFTVPFAFAQLQDSDADGVIDANDMCPQTNPAEGLPIITQNKEFLGCACSQIYNKIGEYCYDVFCSTNRPFSVKERAYSSRQMNCSADYCRGNTLYDFPENKPIKCINGKEEEFSCDAAITENSELCINGTVAEYVPPEKAVFISQNITILDDYQKLQSRAYELSQNIEIITDLGISGEEIFLTQSDKTMNSVVIEKNLRTDIKSIGSANETISTKTIKITPNKHKTLKNLYIFEELPRGSKVDINDVIPGTSVILEDKNSPPLLVWKIDRVSKPVEITYQVNKQLQGDSNTLLVAKEIKSGFWKLMILPAIFIIVVVWVFIYTSQKAIPKRKKIFKE